MQVVQCTHVLPRVHTARRAMGNALQGLVLDEVLASFLPSFLHQLATSLLLSTLNFEAHELVVYKMFPRPWLPSFTLYIP